MPNIPYINYKELDEFYTIPQLCSPLDLSKQELRAIGEKLFANSGKKRYNEFEVTKDVKH